MSDETLKELVNVGHDVSCYLATLCDVLGAVACALEEANARAAKAAPPEAPPCA